MLIHRCYICCMHIMLKSCSSDIAPGFWGGMLFSSNGSKCIIHNLYLCGVRVCVCVFVCVSVCKLYQTLQSIGLIFIRYLRVRVRAMHALHASLINTIATHPAWPQHFVSVNPRAPFSPVLHPPPPPPFFASWVIERSDGFNWEHFVRTKYI